MTSCERQVPAGTRKNAWQTILWVCVLLAGAWAVSAGSPAYAGFSASPWGASPVSPPRPLPGLRHHRGPDPRLVAPNVRWVMGPGSRGYGGIPATAPQVARPPAAFNQVPAMPRRHVRGPFTPTVPHYATMPRPQLGPWTWAFRVAGHPAQRYSMRPPLPRAMSPRQVNHPYRFAAAPRAMSAPRPFTPWAWTVNGPRHAVQRHATWPSPPIAPWSRMPRMYGSPDRRYVMRPLPAVLAAGPLSDKRTLVSSLPPYAMLTNPYLAAVKKGRSGVGALPPVPRRPMTVSSPHAASGGVHPGVYRFRPANRPAVSRQVFRYDGRDWRFRPVAQPETASPQPTMIRHMPPAQGQGLVGPLAHSLTRPPPFADSWAMHRGPHSVPTTSDVCANRPEACDPVPAASWPSYRHLPGTGDRQRILTSQPSNPHPLQLPRAG